MSSDVASDILPKELPALPNILVFHKITDRLSFGSTNYAPRRLMHLFDLLIGAGYRLRSVARIMSQPDDAAVAVCFDDGYQHLRDIIPRVVDKYHVRPTVFVPTAFIGRINEWDYSSLLRPMRHLEVDAIRELAALGVAFGSHGHRHVSLTTCSPSQLREELVHSRSILEDLIGRETDSISYPFGRYNPQVMDVARDAGYRYGFTMRFPAYSNDELATGRYTVYGFDSGPAVLRKLPPGKWRRVECFKGRVVNWLSQGTVLWQRLSGGR